MAAVTVSQCSLRVLGLLPQCSYPKSRTSARTGVAAPGFNRSNVDCHLARGYYMNVEQTSRRYSLFSRDFDLHLTNYGASRQFRTCSASGAGGPASAVASSDAKALSALREAASTLTNLDAGFLKSLPQDLQADAKYSGFQLANGPLNREVGDAAAEILGSLGRAFEALDVKAAAAAAGRLERAVGSLPPGSSERARLGQRLTAFAGPLRSGDKPELQKVANALSTAGQLLAADAEPTPVPDAPQDTPSTEVLQGVSPVFVGLGVAAALLVVFAQLVARS